MPVVNCAEADHHVFVSSAGHGIDGDVCRQQAQKKLERNGETTRIHMHAHGTNCFGEVHHDFGIIKFTNGNQG